MDRYYQAAITGLLSLVIGISAGIFATRWSEHADIDWPTSIKSASDLMTAIGIAIAGVWTIYLIKRRRSLDPRAALGHRMQLWHEGDNRYLRLSVEIRNPSEVIIRPGDGSTSIQRPPAGDIDPKLYVENVWTNIAKVRHCLGFEDVRIDPKESESYTHDIKLPDGVRYIQITTQMACERTQDMARPISMGRPTEDLEIDNATDRWTLTTLVDLDVLSVEKPHVHSTLERAPAPVPPQPPPFDPERTRVL